MAEQLLREFGEDLSEVAIVPSHGGVFQVQVAGYVVFDMDRVGRFPTYPEIRQQVMSRL